MVSLALLAAGIVSAYWSFQQYQPMKKRLEYNRRIKGSTVKIRLCYFVFWNGVVISVAELVGTFLLFNASILLLPGLLGLGLGFLGGLVQIFLVNQTIWRIFPEQGLE